MRLGRTSQSARPRRPSLVGLRENRDFDQRVWPGRPCAVDRGNIAARPKRIVGKVSNCLAQRCSGPFVRREDYLRRNKESLRETRPILTVVPTLEFV